MNCWRKQGPAPSEPKRVELRLPRTPRKTERGLSQAAAAAKARARWVNPLRTVLADALRSGTLRGPRLTERGLSQAEEVMQGKASRNGRPLTLVAVLLRRETSRKLISASTVTQNFAPRNGLPLGWRSVPGGRSSSWRLNCHWPGSSTSVKSGISASTRPRMLPLSQSRLGLRLENL